MLTDIFPVSLDRTQSRELRIVWNDGVEQLLTFKALRAGCQCANCMEKRKGDIVAKANRDPTALPVLSAAETMPLEILKMEPVGNYAYNIEFSDGHSTGVFTFDLLRSLS